MALKISKGKVLKRNEEKKGQKQRLEKRRKKHKNVEKEDWGQIKLKKKKKRKEKKKTEEEKQKFQFLFPSFFQESQKPRHKTKTFCNVFLLMNGEEKRREERKALFFLFLFERVNNKGFLMIAKEGGFIKRGSEVGVES